MSAEDPEARALRESEERFRALSDAAREAVLIHENGIIREVNQAFTALLGYSRAEAIGQYGSLFIAPASLPTVESSMRSAGRGAISEMLEIAKSGARLVFESRAEPIVYQGRPMRVVTMQDLTTRRAAETALRESDERLRDAMNAARMGYWDFDVERNRLTWSPQVYDLFGLERGTFGETLEAFLALIHPADQARVADTIAQRVRGAGTDFS